MPKITLKQHLSSARQQWNERQKFLKSGAVIHASSSREIGKTVCGLSEYQWEEYPWEDMPLADAPSEVTCKNCLAKMK